MAVTAATWTGRPRKCCSASSLRVNLTRGGNNLFWWSRPSRCAAGREYEFEFHHAGKVILDAGDRVFYVTARGNWYPTHGLQVRAPTT